MTNEQQRPTAPTITLPEGFRAPEGNEDTPGEFDAVCRWKVKGDGKSACLIQLGDFKFHYEEPKEEEKPPDYKEYSRSMVSEMDQQPM